MGEKPFQGVKWFSLPKNISLKENPFEYFDNIQITVHGFNLNFYQKYERLAKSALGLTLVSLVGWGLLGFDSTPLQFIESLISVPVVGFNWNQLHIIYDSFYGKEMHWSAFVIYGLLYYFLSKHYAKFGIKKSKNVVFSTSVMLLTVSIFEFYWMFSYAYFQNQWWVVTPMFPQLRILLQNLIFLVVGILGVLYIWADGYLLNERKEVVKRIYRFNWGGAALVLIGLSVLVAVVWWFYPGHVDSLRVQTSWGLWQNSPRFPQTLYTIDVDTTDIVNAGVWFYMPNDIIHAWNTLVKALWAFTIFHIAKLKIMKEEGNLI